MSLLLIGDRSESGHEHRVTPRTARDSSEARYLAEPAATTARSSMSLFSVVLADLVRDYTSEVLGLRNPVRDHAAAWRAPDKLLLFVDFKHLGVEVVGVTLSKFRDGVDSGFLQQITIFLADAFHPH